MNQSTKPQGKVKRIRNSDEWEAWDSRGNYLGFSSNHDEAVTMAEKGWTNNILCDEASELDLWTLWNNCADHCRVFDCGDGTQALVLPGDFVLTAKRDKHGWDVSIETHDDFFETYAGDGNVCRITVAEKPYQVE